MFGRRMKHYQGGVPVVPYQRFVHDFPNLDPSRHARQTFRRWAGLFSVAAGYMFARFTVNPQQLLNPWYNRPDLKPYPAMVHYEEGAKDESIEKWMRYKVYMKQRREQDA
jgi:hypothetical protein